jgi:hypothetical protein
MTERKRILGFPIGRRMETHPMPAGDDMPGRTAEEVSARRLARIHARAVQQGIAFRERKRTTPELHYEVDQELVLPNRADSSVALLVRAHADNEPHWEDYSCARHWTITAAMLNGESTTEPLPVLGRMHLDTGVYTHIEDALDTAGHWIKDSAATASWETSIEGLVNKDQIIGLRLYYARGEK